MDDKQKYWNRTTRSQNRISEQIRKRISDKTHFRPSTGKIDMKKIIVAKTKKRR